MTALTTSDQEGAPDHAPQAQRRDFQAHPMHAVVGRTGHGKADGPGGKAVFLTKASVQQPLPVFDDDEARRLLENGCINEAKQRGDVGHPPQQPERAVRVPGLLTLLMCALATAYRLPCAREAPGGESVGWQRWRRQLLEQTRDKVIVFAQGY